MPQTATLTLEERLKGGWYHSRSAVEMAKKSLLSVQKMPSYFPHINATSFEKDIAYLEGLRIVASKIAQISDIVANTKRVLLKDISEQATYTYRQLKLMHENGIAVGNDYPNLKKMMPKTGKKKKKE